MKTCTCPPMNLIPNGWMGWRCTCGAMEEERRAKTGPVAEGRQEAVVKVTTCPGQQRCMSPLSGNRLSHFYLYAEWVKKTRHQSTPPALVISSSSFALNIERYCTRLVGGLEALAVA